MKRPAAHKRPAAAHGAADEVPCKRPAARSFIDCLVRDGDALIWFQKSNSDSM